MIDKIKVGTNVHSIVPMLSTSVFDGSAETPLRLSFEEFDYGLTIAVGSGLACDDRGLYVNTQYPIAAGPYGVSLKLHPDKAGLVNEPYGLRVGVGTGLAADSDTVSIVLAEPGALSATEYGLALSLAPDTYEDTPTLYCSLDTTSYGLHLVLSKHTATVNDDVTYVGNAITPTPYGLSLKIGPGLCIDSNALDVKVSSSTLLSGGQLVENNAITKILGGDYGPTGLTLKLKEREIGGRSRTLLTTSDGSLDIDIDALKEALGLS